MSHAHRTHRPTPPYFNPRGHAGHDSLEGDTTKTPLDIVVTDSDFWTTTLVLVCTVCVLYIVSWLLGRFCR